MDFDESKALEHMHAALAETATYDDDELLNIIDMIYDFYEANGLLDIDADGDDDEEIDIDDITAYVSRMLARDKGAHVQHQHVEPLVKAYIEYENSLDQA